MELMIVRTLAKLLDQWPQGVEFHPKPGPIASFQPLEGTIIVAQGLACAEVQKTGSVRSSRRGSGGGFLEKGGQRPCQRLFHDHAVAIGGDHALKFGNLASLGSEIKR